MALTEPNGLLAAGAALSPAGLIEAYGHGIFPWSSEDQPLLWWSPDPRMAWFPAGHKEDAHLYVRNLRTGKACPP